jgi:hypothetical protein
MQHIRPLPGIAFRAEPPPVVALPRMDVAAFVGFAQKGPVNIPVPVEDYPRFTDIFGGTYYLAWDEETMTWQTACLAPAVKDFFAQGGRRCWVVRVANNPVVNRFPIAGLLKTTVSGAYTSVQAHARSGGSWSDSVQVGATILYDMLQVRSNGIVLGNGIDITAAHLSRQPLVAGELLQLDCSDEIHRAYVVLHNDDLTVSDDAVQINASRNRIHWFRRIKHDNPALVGTARTVVANNEPNKLRRNISAVGTFQPAAMLLEAIDNANFVEAIEVGDWITFQAGMETIWMLVSQKQHKQLSIQAAWYQGFNANVPLLQVARTLRVRMALQIREGLDSYHTFSDLSFSTPHPRFIGYLPADETLFNPNFGKPQSGTIDETRFTLWGEAQNPRFPIHVPLGDEIVLPLGLESSPIWREAEHLPTDTVPLVRDGLVPPVADIGSIAGSVWSDFWQTLYLDPLLRYAGQRSLLAEANDLLYFKGQDLKGLHTLFPVEEVSMVALPDANHRGWYLTERQQVDIEKPPVIERVNPCSHADRTFKPCVEKPPEDEDKEEVPHSEVIQYWKLLIPREYVVDGLLEIQIQLAKLAAARGDFIAMLALPKTYRTAQALQHQRVLYRALRFQEETTPSYVALYHPWVVSRDDNGELLHITPDAAACGVTAKRSLERGAWVAPANVALRGTLSLLPLFSLDDEISLYNAGINLIQRQAQGFVVWGANTQSLDPEFSSLNVRRLLILLRRLALIEGQTYVFAPHSPAFRRRVQQIFERHLAILFERGAFAGNNPAEAYQVVIDETLNTQKSIEQGRLIIELHIAPSRPITFITVRLVQTASGLVTLQEVVTNG